jgi:hypothetical protein
MVDVMKTHPDFSRNKCIKALPKYMARHEKKGAALFNILIGALDFTDADQAATDISLRFAPKRDGFGLWKHLKRNYDPEAAQSVSSQGRLKFDLRNLEAKGYEASDATFVKETAPRTKARGT